MDTEVGQKMIDEQGVVCDKLKVVGIFAPHTEM